MKKVILPLILAAAIILSGCVSDNLSQGRGGPVSRAEVADTVISKVKANVDTHTFEGFTGESTYGDCAAKIQAKMDGSEIITYGFGDSLLKYNCELLGYPAVAECGFSNNESGKSLLDSIYFIIYPGEGAGGGSEKGLIEKLSGEVGVYRTIDWGDITCYLFEGDEWAARLAPGGEDRLEFSGGQSEQGCIATLDVYSPEFLLDGAAQTPDVFHFQLGADIAAVCSSGMLLTDPADSTLSYNDGELRINMRFKADSAGALRLCGAEYGFAVGKTVDYYESLADSLESAIGKPLSRGYILPDTEGGHIMWLGPGCREGCSADDARRSGTEYFRFKMEWPGIIFESGSGEDTSLDFGEAYFKVG